MKAALALQLGVLEAYASDAYPGVYIARVDKGWIWYWEPEADDGNQAK